MKDLLNYLTKLNEPENIPAEIICASQVEVKEVSWLWKGYIPFGKITLLQGDPGDGKSTFVLNLAAMLTSGSQNQASDRYRLMISCLKCSQKQRQKPKVLL